MKKRMDPYQDLTAFESTKREYHQDLVNIRRRGREMIFHSKRFPQQMIYAEGQHQDRQEQDDDRQSQEEEGSLIVDPDYRNQIQEIFRVPLKSVNLDDITEDLHNEVDLIASHWGVICLRRMILKFEQALIQPIIDRKLVPVLVKMCRRDDRPQLKREASWILSNMTAGSEEQAGHLLDQKVDNVFLSMLEKQESYLISQSIIGLENFVLVGRDVRDNLISKGLLDKLWKININVLTKSFKISLIEIISNILRSQPSIPQQQAKICLAFMCQAFKSNWSDGLDEPTNNIFESMARYHDEGNIRMYAKQGMVQLIIIYSLFFCEKSPKQHQNSLLSAAHMLMRFSYFSDLVKVMIKHGFLDLCAIIFITTKSQKIVKEYLFTLSNVAADQTEITDQLIDNEQLMQMIVTIFKEGSTALRKEICYIYGNVASHATPALSYAIFNKHRVAPMLVESIMETDDDEYLEDFLTNYANIIKLGDCIGEMRNMKINDYWVALTSNVQVMEKVCQLDGHPISSVREAFNAIFLGGRDHLEEQEDYEQV